MNEPKGLMKVVYEHDGRVRALRGKVTIRDDGFVEIRTTVRSVLIKKEDIQLMSNIPAGDQETEDTKGA
jgi:hypothetical protein